MKKIKKDKIIKVSIIILVVILICVFKNVKKNSHTHNESQVVKSYSTSEQAHTKLMKNIKTTYEIEVYHDYFSQDVNQIKPINIKDKSIIDDYIRLLSKVVKKSNEEISGGSVKNQKIIFFTEKGKVEVKYSYDDLCRFGYITYGGKNIYLDYSLFSLISNTERYSKKTSNIDEDVKKLLNKYNWTPSFLIAKHSIKLPNDLMYAPEKGIDEVYWAYNLQLSKSINLDFSNMLGEKVDAQVYYLLEPMPSFTEPIIDSRAVVLKHKGKIIGAYIDSGISNRAISSLNRKSFEDVTGDSLENYLIKNHIDENSKLNKELSKLSTRELIEMHYNSMMNKDVGRYLATLDMGAILSLLERSDFNTLEYGLFNNLDSNNEIFTNANKVKVLNVNDSAERKNEKDVEVEMNILEANQVNTYDGICIMIALMVKNDNNTYKINSIGF